MSDLGEWFDCTRCGLHEFRRKVVIGRGDMPADILFIGEAPGKSEDLRGVPFIGPSGRLLRAAMEDASSLAKLNGPPSHYITNIVGCRPTDRISGPNRQPTQEEAETCWGRLDLIEGLVKPKRIVFLGKVAKDWCKNVFTEGTALVHPAYVLRMGGVESSEYSLFCRNLSEVFRELAA